MGILGPEGPETPVNGRSGLKRNCGFAIFRVAPVRFGSVTVVRAVPVFERFRRFLCKKVFFVVCFSTVQEERTVPVPVSVPGKRFRRFRSVSGKTVPTVPVSGSGSVPEPL